MQEVKQDEVPRYLSHPVTGRSAQVGYVQEGAAPERNVALFTEPDAIAERYAKRLAELAQPWAGPGEFGSFVRVLSWGSHSLFADKVSALLPLSPGKACEVLAENFSSVEGVKKYLSEGPERGFFSSAEDRLENSVKFILRHEGAHCAQGERIFAAGLGEAFADAKAVLIGYQEVLRSNDPAKIKIFVEQAGEHIRLRPEELDRVHKDAAMFLPAVLALPKDEVLAMSLVDMDSLVRKWASDYLETQQGEHKRTALGDPKLELRFPARPK